MSALPFNALDLPAFKPLALFSSLLVLKMFAVAFTTALSRSKSGVVVNPEDTTVNKGAHTEAQDAPSVLRAKRAHLNDCENIPGFLALAVIFTLMGASSTAGWAYFGLYFAARSLHTICYLASLQPWRTVMFFVGQITMLGVLVQILMRAFH
jgi:uncharacterized MAPEG superfamily protein